MDTNSKILRWDNIQSALKNHRSKKIVHCHGVFDLLHLGHIKHLSMAKKFGDILIVSITADEFVNKGPGHPAFPDHFRSEALAALNVVDFVVINYEATSVNIIHEIQPNFYVKGNEYQNATNDITGKIVDERLAVEKHGGKLVFTDDITFSSSNLINRYLPHFPDHVQKWMLDFKEQQSVHEIIELIDSLKELNVLVIGETIIDEYQYCTAMGKSGKEPVLATQYIRTETYAGGILAVANHVAGFCKQVKLLSFLGDMHQHRDFCEKSLRSNVDSTFLAKENSPTLCKKRFLEGKQKLFEIYEMNNELLSEQQEELFITEIEKNVSKADLVIVADYGHGIISEKVAQKIAQKAPFLAINTQDNAGNHGLNSISKYPRADFITFANRELQLEVKSQLDLDEKTLKVAEKMSASQILVTHGEDGMSIFNKELGRVQTPALATSVNDRVGAGDSVLSLTALLSYKKVPPVLIGFLGNVVGAEAVSSMGNSRYVEASTVKKHVTHLLK